MRTVLATLLVTALLGSAGAALFVWGGAYDVSSTRSHTQPVYTLLETAMRRSVQRRAAQVELPPPAGPQQLARGAACFRDHCVQCHGGPGVSQGDIGKSMQPLPGPLVDAARRWAPRELYWITRHGITMSGMPAWELRLPDADLWAVTAFLQALPRHSPASYREAVAELPPDACRSLTARCAAGRCDETPSADLQPLQPRGRDEAAQLLLRQYACVTCHRVPGVVGSDVQVGPPLLDLWRRERIAGDLPNTAENLARWIREPQRLRPGSAMPDLGVSEAHAGRIAAYLLDPRR